MESEKEFLTLKDGYYQNRSFTSNFIKVDGKNFTVHYVVSFDYPDMEAQGLYNSNFLGRSLITCSRHQSLQIFVFQFSKSLFLFIEGGQENIFHWPKKYFRPIKLFSCPPSINKNKDLEFEYLETLMS
mgnify:CR=1 FL=1